MLASFSLDFVWPCLSDSRDICGPKWHIKCPRKFRPSPWILPIKKLRGKTEGKNYGEKLRDQSEAFGNKSCVGRVYSAEFTPGVQRLCWKSSHSVFLKTLNDFLLVWTSFLAFSFRCVCALYVWVKFPQRGPNSSFWGGDSSVVRAPDSWLKGRGFESLQERRENFLLQGRLSVLTLISVSVPPPYYRGST